MKPEFWHERWEKGEIGFHQHDFNRHMQDFVDRLGAQAEAQVLVPLCGKSLDMLWLVDQGYRVTGIEISERAVQNFYAENDLDHEIINQAGLTLYRGEKIDIYCTDFFKMDQKDLPLVEAVYDRASLIALPPAMRRPYAEHLSSLIGRGVRSLLITLEYPQAEMRGPPFSVTPAEVRQLFGTDYRIEHIHSEDCLAHEPRFRKKGLTRLDEHVFILQSNA